MDILIFKTNLTRQRQSIVANALADLRGLTRWTVDYEDCDGIGRPEGAAHRERICISAGHY